MSNDKEKSIMKSRMRTILVMLPLLWATSAFAQNEGKLFKAFDDEKVDELVESVQKMKKFKDYDYNENTVTLFAEELFKQYYLHKDAKVSFTEDAYNALVNREKELEKTITRLRADSAKFEKEKADLKVDLLKGNETKNKELEKTIARLRADSLKMEKEKADLKLEILKENERKTEKLEKTIARLRNDSTSLANANVKLQTEYNAKDSELKAANQSLKDEKDKTKAYEEAFADITKAIDEGYKNKTLTFTKMDERSLTAAIEKYQSTEDLLKANKVLYKDLQPKVEEMKSWKYLKQTLDGAVTYMTEKYNDSKRKTCIDEITKAFKAKNLNLTKEQIAEKDNILKALEDQKTVHANFMEVINACRMKKALSKQADIDNIMNALEIYDKSASVYHVSYHNAVKILRDELKGGPNNSKLYDNNELETKILQEMEKKF